MSHAGQSAARQDHYERPHHARDIHSTGACSAAFSTCQTSRGVLSLDDALRSTVGEFGWGQSIVLTAASLSWASVAAIVLSMVFTSLDPVRSRRWQCVDSVDAQCKQAYDTGQGFCSLQPHQYFWTHPHVSVVSTFDLTCSNSWKVGVANAGFFVGYWVGSYLFGWISDAHGRKQCLLISNWCTAMASTSCAFCISYRWYCLARCLIGFSAAGLPVASYILATESVGPSWRGRAGLISQLFYHLGEWMLPVIAWVLLDWRMLMLATAAMCVVTGALAMLIPESPRWLLVKGQQHQAYTVLRWLAHHNGKEFDECISIAATSSTQQEDQKAQAQTLKLNQHQHLNCNQNSKLHAVKNSTVNCANQTRFATADDHQQQDQYTQHLEQQCTQHSATQKHAQQTAAAESGWLVLTHPLLFRYFSVSSILCAVGAIGFYVVSLATDNLSGSLYLNFFITSFAEFPAALLCVLAIDRIGRRPTVLTGFILSGCTCLACGFLHPVWLRVTFATIGKGSISAVWGVMITYAAELFPTSLRSTALAGVNQCSRLGGIIAPAIVYLGVHFRSEGLPFWSLGVMALAASLLVSCLPETRGTDSPDTTEDLQCMQRCMQSGVAQSADDAHADQEKHRKWGQGLILWSQDWMHYLEI